jgi:3-oxoacyl-[acyl-carrier-protein] synthase II
VAVTGVGSITALGSDAPSTWRALVEGRSGVRRLQELVDAGDRVSAAAKIDDAVASALAGQLPSDARARSSRFTHFAVAAAREAIAHARRPHVERPDRFGVAVGVGIGVPHPSEGYTVGPTTILRVLPNAAPAWISILEGLRGPSFACSTACASGAHAIGLAFDQIRLGRVDGMIAGGVDTVLTRDVVRAFAWMRALNGARDEDPTVMSRPFDATRRGFVLGEGAGFLVLEALDHARARGAEVLAEMRGWGATSDAFHIVAVPEGGEGMARAMRLALEDASLAPEEVAYVSAHGTSTKMNDREETRAIRAAFGRHADRLMVSSQKSMIGHAMGGAGAIEAVVTVQSLVHQIATPTINLTTADPECDLDYVPNVARRAPIGAAISNSFGFGGHDCSLAFARTEVRS